VTPRSAFLIAVAWLAILAGGPAFALAQETESTPASSVVEVLPKGDELPRKPPNPEALAEEPCAESRECALRLGYGNVCEQNRCEPYVDRRDIVDVFRKTPKPKAEPEPFAFYPSIIPAIGYNPALGFLIGIVSKAGMLLGDPRCRAPRCSSS
jgi:hypothetical protein